MPVSTAEYNPCGWRAWLNNTTISLGMQNVFDEDPPFVAGAFENGYDESLATIKGRFWYSPAKEKILIELEQLIGFPNQAASVTRRSPLRKNRRLARAEIIRCSGRACPERSRMGVPPASNYKAADTAVPTVLIRDIRVSVVPPQRFNGSGNS